MSMRALTKRNEDTKEMEWISPEDRAKIAAWMDGDADHKGMSPDLFLEELTEPLMFSDEKGDVFALRLSRCIRMDIQFNTDPDPETRERIRLQLMRYFPWLAAEAKKKGFRQLIFDSVSRQLIAFCRRRFGFKHSPNEFIAGV